MLFFCLFSCQLFYSSYKVNKLSSTIQIVSRKNTVLEIKLVYEQNPNHKEQIQYIYNEIQILQIKVSALPFRTQPLRQTSEISATLPQIPISHWAFLILCLKLLEWLRFLRQEAVKSVILYSRVLSQERLRQSRFSTK